MKAYTYNDRLVGVGNDQILGTDQGGGSTYTAGNGIDITNDVISVDDTVALVSALPTTELGKFTIQSNVSGGPIEVICPTDQGHPIETVILDNNAVSGTSGSGTSSVYIVYKSPGYDDDYYSEEGAAILHIPEAVTGIAYVQLVYAPNSNPVTYGGPYFTNPSQIVADSTGGRYVLDAGDYDVNVIANAAGQGSGYGKYITLYAAGPAPDVQALLKSSFSLAVRHPELGITVNLDRYTLGNTNTITNTSGYTQATIYTDPTTKKQSVYLPSSAPSNWNLKTAVFFQYGSSSFGYSNADTSHDYIAYKYNSTTRNYEFAELVNTDYNAKKFTFARTYDGAIEYWIADCTNGYYSATWSTETIDMSDCIPYSASGVYLPNSKFEIDTDGQAYKIVSEASESDYGSGAYSWSDGAIYFHTPYTQVGTYTATFPSNTDHLSISQGGGIGFTYTFDSTTHSATFNISALPAGAWAYVWAKDSNDYYISIGSNNTPVKYQIPAVKEEYLTEGDLELNGDNQVTAIDGHALAGNDGTTYTAGQYISIDSNDVISVTGLQVAGNYATTSDISDMATKTWVGNQGYLTSVPSNYATDIEVSQAIASSIVQSDWAVTAVDSPAYIDNKPETLEMELSPVTGGNCISITEGNAGSIDWITTAGITDIVSVTALPANPVATVIYLIPET